ncbi:type I site-specific deoxyribonuclease [Prevotella intermedia]|uniref:Type I site-specific deoxyribonuclease n=3 Tax=Prevotellaceae TaxID=171552 RepID=A0A2M8TPG6_PREIN|nr:restriction endonuclease subunit S [Prevotella intermedia]PJI25824.1 type I site-specific deoxyribonuclease [Prevotella intermedia]
MDTKKLRQKILDLAIHGKLVPQDPNDEPASVLLERIRAEKERLISEGKIKRSRKTLNTTDTHHYEQDVPFEVPQGWVWCKLDDLAFYKKGPFGSSLTKSMFVLKGDNTYKVYEQKNAIQKNEKLGTYYISKEKYQELIAFAIQPFDIIVSCAGTIGETFVLPQEPMEGIINQALMLVRLYNRDIEKFYLLYFDYILKEEAYKESKGTAIKNIPPFDVLKNFYIPLPPFSEQQRIVAEIERWFALIDTIEQGKVELQTAIKQTKSKILDLAIHGKLVPQDPNDEPAIELVRRINPKAQITCDNGHYAQLPREWSVISMQDVCKLKDGIKLDSTPLINLDVKYLRGTSAGKVIDSGKFVTANSYMILVDGENSGEVFKTPIDGYQGSTFKLLDIDQNIDEKYILNVINLHRKALRENKVGSAIPHLNKKLFKAISVPLPPYNEQVRIVEAIKSTFNLLDALKENL